MIRSRRQNTTFKKRNFRELKDEESARQALKLSTDKVCSCPSAKVLLRTWEWERDPGSLNPGLCQRKPALTPRPNSSATAGLGAAPEGLQLPAKVYAPPVYFPPKNTGVYPSSKAPLAQSRSSVLLHQQSSPSPLLLCSTQHS